MSSVNPYFSWRVHVLRLLRESGHRMDEHGPILTAKEIDRMESFWHWGYSPEEFVETLQVKSARV